MVQSTKSVRAKIPTKSNASKSSRPEPKEKYLLVVRHGERLDFLGWDDPEKAEREFENEHDSPLSLNGCTQAFKTGQHIQSSLLNKLKQPKVRIFSSPFTRCIQTSAGILKGIEAKKIHKDSRIIMNGIEIREELSELLASAKPEYFTTIEELELNKLGAQKFVDQQILPFSDLVDPTRPVIVRNLRELGKPCFKLDYRVGDPEFGETMELTQKRYQGFFNKTKESFQEPDHPEVIICVSHGNSVDSTLGLWMSADDKKKYKMTEWPPLYTVYNIAYCCTTTLQLTDKKYKLVGDFASSEHIGLGKANIEKD